MSSPHRVLDRPAIELLLRQSIEILRPNQRPRIDGGNDGLFALGPAVRAWDDAVGELFLGDLLDSSSGTLEESRPDHSAFRGRQVGVGNGQQKAGEECRVDGADTVGGPDNNAGVILKRPQRGSHIRSREVEVTSAHLEES